MPFEGRTNVNAVGSFWGEPSDTLRFAYEANNDVSLSLPISSRKRAWLTMPTSSSAPRTVDVADTLADASGVTIERRTFTASREDVETITIHGQTIASVIVRMNVRTISITNGATTLDDTQDLFLHWVPYLCHLSGVYVAARRVPMGGLGRYQQILDYHLN